MAHQPRETEHKPRVLIDWKPNGDYTVYADGDVTVYSRCAHTPNDRLYRYTPEPVPESWLHQMAGWAGDGSEAERRLHSFLPQSVG